MSVFIANEADFHRQVEALAAAIDTEAEQLLDNTQAMVHRILLVLGGYAAVYPAPPPGSTYRRTGTLGRLWTSSTPSISIAGSVLNARLGNATPYGPYVQDPDRQAKVHRGRWQTTDDVVDKHAGVIEPLLKEVGLKLVERIANAV